MCVISHGTPPDQVAGESPNHHDDLIRSLTENQADPLNLGR